MSLELVRVDARLIHGQVICSWLPYVKGTSIIIANDSVSQNPSIQTIMRLSLPEGVCFRAAPVSEIVNLLNQKEFKQEKILLLFSSIRDLQSAVQAGLAIKSLNIGITEQVPQGVPLTKTVSVTPEELEFLEQLTDCGVDIDLRMVPVDHPASFQKVLAKVKNVTP